MSVAAKLTNQIIDFIYRRGGYAFRASSIGIYDRKLGYYRTASKKGVADILAVFRGQFIAIEVKIGKDKLSDEQVGFLKTIEHYGGLSFIAKDLRSFSEWWDKQYPADSPILVNDELSTV